jgi:hypothetical protein
MSIATIERVKFQAHYISENTLSYFFLSTTIRDAHTSSGKCLLFLHAMSNLLILLSHKP